MRKNETGEGDRNASREHCQRVLYSANNRPKTDLTISFNREVIILKHIAYVYR